MELKDRVATPGYVLKETMKHASMVEFIKPWLKKKNVYTRIYNFTMMAGLFAVSVWIGMSLSRGTINFEAISQFLFGGVLGFLIIPVHELLHGLAYKLLGAKSVQYRANWRKLVFFAAANEFPTGYKEFRIIALMPFAVITTFGILAMVLSGFVWSAFFLGFILIHASCCGGDFGLLSYMYEHRKEEIITIDDTDIGETRFLVKA